MKKVLLLSVTTSVVLLAGAYKVSEQSLNSMALGSAYVAHTSGADTAYFNPANMAFMEDAQFVEGGVTWAHLPRNTFKGDVTAISGESKVENLQLPFFHYVTKPIGDFRWGASLTVPGGLTKRWESPVQKAVAEEFTLEVLELNPVVSYKVSDNLAVGGGVRLLYAKGVVKSDASAVHPAKFKRDMEGDTTEFGYNLAVTYKPTSDINMALTYRSKIDLNLDGTAKLSSLVPGTTDSYSASVSVPFPAALNVAVSKTWQDKYTVELNYEKTYWSTYKELDFNYERSIGALAPVFDKVAPKNWKDTKTLRIGFTADVSDKLTLMASYVKDETPMSKKYVSYELPDSDANIYTFGFRIKVNENLSYGAAYLRDEKDSFSLKTGENSNGIVGDFSAGGADLITVGMAYKF